MVERLFYELIQVALGQRDNLSRPLSELEWSKLLDFSQKQAVVGVTFSALEKLGSHGQKPPREILYKWFGLSEQIRHNNLMLTNHCQQLQQLLKEKGLRSSILKGQGIALYYDEPLREFRQSGDIDIYVCCGRNGALDLARQLGVECPEWDYKHLHLDIIKGVEIEMHYRVEVLLNLWKNRKLQRWLDRNEEQLYEERTGLVTPTTEFNLFYILLHIYRHFLYEGVGMRQLMDYYFVLKAYDGRSEIVTPHSGQRPEKEDIRYLLKEFGMERFARGVMWMMKEVFCLESKYMYCEPLESEGEFILNEVMKGGNFGHYDKRLSNNGGKMGAVKAVCKHNWHLISHYPQEIIWPPIWFIYHKCWKLTR